MKYSGASSFSVILIFVSLSLLAFIFIPLLSIQLTPSRTFNSTMTISFSWPNASARIVEQEVTSKLEGLFSTVKGLSNIESVSQKGGGQVTVSFNKSVRLDMTRFELAMLIRQCKPNLPEGVTYPQISLGTSGRNVSPILTYTFNGNASPYFLQTYAEENFVSRLSLKGVSQVSVSEAPPYHWEIEFDTERLHALGLQATEVESALKNYFQESSAGKGFYTERGAGHLYETDIKVVGHSEDSVDWGSIPVRKVKERIIYLNDVASVGYKEMLPSSYSRINGLNSIVVSVFPEEGTNALELAERVRAEVEDLRDDLPHGYLFLLTSDSTKYLSEDLQRIGWRTLLSLALLLTFVWISSRQAGYLFVIFVSLVMNLLIACIFYYMLQVEIHLYSLAGITISLGIIINNSIVMIDHLMIRRNKNVFLALIGATLSTMAALSVIFFLKAEQQADLVDLAWIILINLAISLIVAYSLIPALMDKIDLFRKKRKLSRKRALRIVSIARFYSRSIRFGQRYAWIYIAVLVLGFGIPFFLLPDRIGKEDEEVSFWGKLYNQSLGSAWFVDLRPAVEKTLGGSLRLFAREIFSNSYYGEPSRIKLRITAAMPEGSSVQQMDETIRLMENLITRNQAVESFKTSVPATQPPSATIEIQFKPEYEYGAMPFALKSQLEDKALGLGGADWSIAGSPADYFGRGFYNMTSPYVSGKITLEGYNYDQLYRYASMAKDKLAENARVQELAIVASPNAFQNKRPIQEFYVDFDEEKMAQQKVSMTELYAGLNEWSFRRPVLTAFFNNKMESVWMVSDRTKDFNLWDFSNTAFGPDEARHKMSELGNITKRRSGNSIYKYNQQYRLEISYNFVGSNSLEKVIRERTVDEMNEILPLGYSAKSRVFAGSLLAGNQYYLLGLIIVIIFFICSVLFESLKQPFAILLLIPVTFIGAFLTFYLFGINFDQGGYASFVLLIGLSVNAGIFIINDYNNLKRLHPRLSDLELYQRAFRHKITPIALTILSTVVGLVPFLLGAKHDVFWYAFAAGTIGGLVFSMLGVVFFLPLFMLKKETASPPGFMLRS